MKTAIIVHGMPSEEEYERTKETGQTTKHWIPWVKQKLEDQNIRVATPEMPEPFRPVYEKWKETFEQFPVDEDTILIGHSCGGGFLVRWLSENKIKAGKVVLVAPWIDIDHGLTTGMFEFTVDPTLIERTHGVTIFYSTDDDAEIIASANMLRKVLPGALVKVFSGMGHFTEEDMGTVEFPELLTAIS